MGGNCSTSLQDCLISIVRFLVPLNQFKFKIYPSIVQHFMLGVEVYSIIDIIIQLFVRYLIAFLCLLLSCGYRSLYMYISLWDLDAQTSKCQCLGAKISSFTVCMYFRCMPIDKPLSLPKCTTMLRNKILNSHSLSPYIKLVHLKINLQLMV